MRLRSESISPYIDFFVSNPGVLSTSGFSVGRIDTNSDFDFFNLYLVSGVQYTLRGLVASPSFDLAVELYDPDINFIGGLNRGGPGVNEVTTFSVPTSGLYRVGVYSNNRASSGDYILTLNADSAIDDFLASTRTTSLLNLNSSVTGNIEIRGDVDWHELSLQAYKTYVFTYSGSFAGGKAYFGIEDGVNLLLQNEGVGVSFEFTPTKSGIYYLSFSPESISDTGRYSIKLSTNENITNYINGSARNEIFTNTIKNDSIDGGSGIDKVIFTGRFIEYKGSFTHGNTISVTNVDMIPNRDGTDTLINVERLQFADKSLALDIGPSQNAGSLYMLYKAAFNRAPDEGGMGYWLAQVDGGKNLVTDIAAGFVKAPEFVAKYGTNPSNAFYVDQLYLNVLGRPGEAGGVAYWNQELNSGARSKAEVLVQFATLPEGAALVADLIANGIPYQQWVG